VPPVGRRTKRLVIGVVKWEPGRNDSAPFDAVHVSRASQKPRAVGGFVYCNIGGEDGEESDTKMSYQKCP
jgi:hypothetical protein